MSHHTFTAAKLKRPAWFVKMAALVVLSATTVNPALSQGGSSHLSTVLAPQEFGLFSTALQKTGLQDRIAAEDRFTLFVIADKAMANEGSAFLLGKVLQTRHNEQRLVNVMSHHLIYGTAVAPEDVKRERLTTASGHCLSLDKSGSGIRVGPEAVVTDVRRIGNGIVYFIDRLLIPPWDQQDEREACVEPRFSSRYTSLVP